MLVALLASCYQPSPPEGAPCTRAGTCPSPLVCDQGLCVRTPRDAGSAPEDGAPGVDAAVEITSFGPGRHEYIVPPGCSKILVKVWGGGGGGGGDSGEGSSGGGDEVRNGGDGYPSTFSVLRANGGRGGAHGSTGSTYLGGTGGSASGGDPSITGDRGDDGTEDLVFAPSGAGGDAPNGGPGGASITTVNTVGAPGTAPGGGGSGALGLLTPAAGGGSGGYSELAFPITPGQKFAVDVGAGGSGGNGALVGGAGADGRVTVQCL